MDFCRNLNISRNCKDVFVCHKDSSIFWKSGKVSEILQNLVSTIEDSISFFIVFYFSIWSLEVAAPKAPETSRSRAAPRRSGGHRASRARWDPPKRGRPLVSVGLGRIPTFPTYLFAYYSAKRFNCPFDLLLQPLLAFIRNFPQFRQNSAKRLMRSNTL